MDHYFIVSLVDGSIGQERRVFEQDTSFWGRERVLEVVSPKVSSFMFLSVFNLTLGHQWLEDNFLVSQKISRNVELELSGKVQVAEKEIAALYVP